MTPAQAVFERIEQMIASGTERPEAFKQLAEELGIKVNSVRGAYYQWRRTQGEPGSPPRTRRRETTPDDALADARKALERAIATIDREVESSKHRAEEAQREYEAVRDSAEGRKEAIRERLEALR